MEKIKSRANPNERIQCAVVGCRFGKLAVAAGERGVCAVALGNSVKSARAEIERRLGGAKVVGGDESLCRLAKKIADAMECSPSGAKLKVKLELRGTDFQRRVWRELQKIPAGKVLTYSELAKKIGRPLSARAVGGACARNPVAILVPCHRAVGNKGELRGYRWGIHIKRALLQKENPPRLRALSFPKGQKTGRAVK